MCLGRQLAVVLGIRDERGDSIDHSISIVGGDVFSENIRRWHLECLAWLGSLNGLIPRDVNNILLFYGGNPFIQEGCLRMQLFAVILSFFHVNGAPMDLRRRFWCLLLTRPCMGENLLLDDRHSYRSLFLIFDQVPSLFLLKMGGLYRVSESVDEVVIGCDAWKAFRWGAFNVWACRGFYDSGRGGARRLIEPFFTFVTLDLAIIDWRATGLFTPDVEVKDALDFYPGLSSCDEESVERPQLFFE